MMRSTPREQTIAGRMRSRLGIIRLLLALDIVALGLVVYDAPVFKVARLRISGVQALAPEDVAHAAAVDGQNLLSVDPRRVEQAVERLTGVKSAMVERRLPNELLIRITERRPAAIWVTSTGPFLVDEEGVVLGPAPVASDLVTVTDAAAGPLKPGSRVDARVISQVQQLKQVLPGAGLTPQAFLYTPGRGLTITAASGWKVHFGGPEDLDLKVAVLRDLLPVVAHQRVELIDVQSPDRPYIR